MILGYKLKETEQLIHVFFLTENYNPADNTIQNNLYVVTGARKPLLITIQCVRLALRWESLVIHTENVPPSQSSWFESKPAITM